MSTSIWDARDAWLHHNVLVWRERDNSSDYSQSIGQLERFQGLKCLILSKEWWFEASPIQLDIAQAAKTNDSLVRDISSSSFCTACLLLSTPRFARPCFASAWEANAIFNAQERLNFQRWKVSPSLPIMVLMAGSTSVFLELSSLWRTIRSGAQTARHLIEVARTTSGTHQFIHSGTW